MDIKTEWILNDEEIKRQSLSFNIQSTLFIRIAQVHMHTW